MTKDIETVCMTATEIRRQHAAWFEMRINQPIIASNALVDAMADVCLETLHGTVKGRAINKIISQPFFGRPFRPFYVNDPD